MLITLQNGIIILCTFAWRQYAILPTFNTESETFVSYVNQVHQTISYSTIIIGLNSVQV